MLKSSPSAGPTARPSRRQGDLAPAADPFGFRFDYTPPPGGYAWWYMDGVSADHRHAIVIIVFVGSVFSPYYAWRKWQDPADHCAINVALYGPPQRWSMTERGAKDTRRTQTSYETGNSRIERTPQGLALTFDEIGAPLPRRIKGRVTIDMPYENRQAFPLDPEAKHAWAPACTHAQITVDFTAPELSWQGSAYVDANYGLEPVTAGFDYWDWSRTPLRDGDTLIRYVTDPVAAVQQSLDLRIAPDGQIRPAPLSPSYDLNASAIWQIRRRTGKLGDATPRLAQTLEDTPFYSRSLLEYADRAAGLTAHETLSCKRLRSPLVKALLPFRMPRLSL
ncbi:MAG: carotenoid 1,2-hydratase [Pseudomonadota bacterium]